MRPPAAWHLWTLTPLVLSMVCLIPGAVFVGSAPDVVLPVMLLAVVAQVVVGVVWMVNATGWRCMVRASVGAWGCMLRGDNANDGIVKRSWMFRVFQVFRVGRVGTLPPTPRFRLFNRKDYQLRGPTPQVSVTSIWFTLELAFEHHLDPCAPAQ